MNQKLSDWASVAEIVSGLAVVTTLIFLVTGIRENTNVIRATAYANSIDSINDFQASLIVNDQAMAAWKAYIQEDTAGLDELNSIRVGLSALVMFRAYEQAYFSQKYGLMGEGEWERFERQICLHFGFASSAGKMAVVEAALTDEFTDYIKKLCSI